MRGRKSKVAVLIVLLLAILVSCTSNKNNIVVQNNNATAPVNTVQVSQGTLIPNDSGIITVAENDTFKFTYDTKGADVYVLDKRNNTVWSNNITQDYYKSDDISPNLMSQLFNVSVALKDGSVEMDQIFDTVLNADKVDIGTYLSDNRLTLKINLKLLSLKFNIVMWLDDTGLNVSIPKDSIVEKDAKLVSLTIMPTFGAALSSEDGYIMYPDGCGALIEFNKSNIQDPSLYTYPIYGENLQDIDKINQDDTDDIKNIMLPVYGIKRTNCGILAAITEGDADAVLNVALSGFQIDNLNRAYFTFNYRSYMINTNSNDANQQSVQIVPYSFATTHTIKYFLLDKQDCDYSGMARTYRAYLESVKILKNPITDTKIPVDVDFFMGINTKSFIFNQFLATTTFDQAGNIIKTLKQKNVDSIQSVLLGWNKGGYDILPTNYAVESKLGGSKGLQKLSDLYKTNNDDLYLNENYLNANTNGGNFNVKKNVIRNYLGQIISDSDQKNYLLNPTLTLMGNITDTYKGIQYGKNTFINFDKIGQLVIADYAKANPTSRQQIVGVYQQALSKVTTKQAKVSVSGGNQYVLPYATNLSSIPDEDSKYFVSTSEVPFYQMVVHGYKNYTSIAGNSSYDFQYQKLKWIEYGSIPYFILTNQKSVDLSKSSYNKLFSSDAKDWLNTIEQTYQEFNKNLSSVWNQQIIQHTILDNDAVKMTYKDGSVIYINYSDKDQQIEGHLVSSENYLLVRRN